MGRRLSDDTRSYAWDLASRLRSYTAGTTTNVFTHNAAGWLDSWTRAGVTRNFAWNFALSLPSISVVRSAGADVIYFVHTPAGELLHSVDAAGVRKYYHFDEMGNTLFVTDDTGAITEKYAYSEYGTIVTSTGQTDQLFLFEARYGVVQLGNGLRAARQRITGAAAGTLAAELGNRADYIEWLANNMHIPAGLPSALQGKNGSHGIKMAKQFKFLKDTSKGAGKIAKIGAVAQVAEVGIETYKYNQAMNQVQAEDDRNREGNDYTYQATIANIRQLYEQGKISAVQRNRMTLAANWNHTEAMVASDFLLETNLVFESAVFVKNGLATFVPFPVSWIGLAPEQKLKGK